MAIPPPGSPLWDDFKRYLLSPNRAAPAVPFTVFFNNSIYLQRFGRIRRRKTPRSPDMAQMVDDINRATEALRAPVYVTYQLRKRIV